MVSGYAGDASRGQMQGQTEANADAETETAGLPVGWTRKDLLALADKVYELLLRDLLVERERGA